MTRQDAEKAGYVFTGCYSHEKEEMKTVASKLRKEGNRAVVVTVPPDPYARGGGRTGYSVYWAESIGNKKIREANERQVRICRLVTEKDELSARIRKIDSEIQNEITAV